MTQNQSFKMNKIDLTDVTFVIPVRIDSQERLENLTLVLEFIKDHFDTTIMVLEADKQEQVFLRGIDNKIFIKDSAPVFHRTKYLNKMMRKAQTPYLAVWDTDVILLPAQMEEAVRLLRDHKADMVYPYDGRFYNVPGIIKNIYLNIRDINALTENVGKMNLMYGSHSVGGAFMVNKKAYEKAGMENESFYGWGPEDVERTKRMEILGYTIRKVTGSLFHLPHPRKENSWFGSKEAEIHNRQEMTKICKLDKRRLLDYISSDSWGKNQVKPPTEIKYIHTEDVHNLLAPSEIVPVIYDILSPRSVVDLGCGIGTFLHYFKNSGCEVLGIDGEWTNKDLLFKHIDPSEFVEANIEEPIQMNNRFDLALSLEVAEHLKENCADTYVETLVSLSDVILFSAAIPGQGGQNHVNEQWVDYWIAKFSEHDYVFHDVLRPIFWENENVDCWYKQNMFLVSHVSYKLDQSIFYKYNPSKIHNYIHPELFYLKMRIQSK